MKHSMFAILLWCSVSSAAPVPTHLMPERVPIGTWVRWEKDHFIVIEIKIVKGLKYYKLLRNGDTSLTRLGWATEASVMAVIRDESKFFLIYVDFEQ